MTYKNFIQVYNKVLRSCKTEEHVRTTQVWGYRARKTITDNSSLVVSLWLLKDLENLAEEQLIYLRKLNAK